MPRRRPKKTTSERAGRDEAGGDVVETGGGRSEEASSGRGGSQASKGRAGLPILPKLLLVCVLPAVLTFGAFGFMAHYESRATLERELGRRLVAIAQAAAASIRSDEIEFLEPGDEESRTYKSLKRRLERLRRAAGMSRIYLFDGESLRSVVDTRAGAAIGSKYYHLDVQRSFLERVLRRGYGASLLYKSQGKLYKTGFAVMDRKDGKPLAVVAVEGRAEQYEALGALSRRLLILGGGGALVLVALTALLARRLAQPLRRLAQAAQVMAGGTLDRPIPVAGGGEVAQVARTMEYMRKELRKRDERLQMMLAGVAHEVRNPLGGMELIVGMLREDCEDDPELVESVDRIQKELDYLKRVVQDFLEYARWDLKETQTVSLLEPVREAVELLSREAEEHGVEVDFSGVSEEVKVFCDVEPVRRVVLNLIKNGIQAAKTRDAKQVHKEAVAGEGHEGRGGHVWVEVQKRREAAGHGGREETKAKAKVGVEAEEEAGLVELVVRDDGPGIEPELVDKIFEPFYTSKQQGTGLGLALGRKVAEAHGGYLQVEAGSPKDSGAAFVLGLPRREPTG